jgi:hypothetical protein
LLSLFSKSGGTLQSLLIMHDINLDRSTFNSFYQIKLLLKPAKTHENNHLSKLKPKYIAHNKHRSTTCKTHFIHTCLPIYQSDIYGN